MSMSETPAGVPVDIADRFETLALTVVKAGFKRYSADAILHRIRWHEQVERGNRDFKCNDHWTSVLARWFLHQHPEHTGLFELRNARREDAA